MKKKTILFVALGLLSAAVCFSGGQQGGEVGAPVTLSVTHNWWGGDAHAPWTDWVFNEDFPAKYPNIKLEVNQLTSAVFRQKIRANFLAEAPTDINIFPGGAETEQFVAAGYLADTTEIMKAYKDEYIQDPALVGFTIGGKLYGQPLCINFFSFNVNRDIWNKYGFKIPEVAYKIDEFNAMLKKLKAGGLIPITLPGKGHNVGGIFSSYIFNQTTKNYAIEKAAYGIDNVKFTDPGFIKGAEIIRQWHDMGFYDPNIEGTDMAQSEVLFMEGNSAVNFNAIWRMGAFPKEIRDKMEPIRMPEVPGFTEDPSIVTSQVECGWIYSKSSMENRKKVGAMKTFIDYMASLEVQQKLIDLTDNAIPALKGVSLQNASYGVKRMAQMQKESVARPFNFYYVSPDQQQKSIETSWNLILGRKTPTENMQILEAVPKNQRTYDFH